MDIEENMEQESIEIQEKFKKIKIDIEGNRQLELKDKMKNEDEGKKSSKSNNDIQTESNKNVQNEGNKEKYEVKKEVVNECEEVVLLNNEVVIEVKKEFNNEIYLKSESYKKLDTEMLVDPTFLQESHGIVQEKQQKTEKDSEIGLNIGIKINLVSQNKLDVIVKKEFIENQQIFENLTDVQLMIQVDNSELQQELDREVQEELDIEKQVIPGRSIKIELNIEVKPKSKNQPQLDIIVQKEIDKKKQLISKTDQETNMEIEELDKNVLKKSEKQQNIDEKKVNEYVDDKLEGLDENKKHTFYENTPPVDKNIQVESNDENKNHTTIIGQHFECDLQSVTNSELKKNTKEDHLESNNISQEQVDKEILLEVEKALYDHKIILGQEARAKKKIQDQDIETDIETFHGEIVQEIEKLMSDDQQEEIQPNLIESINVIKQKIEELKIKIDESVQKYEDEVLKEINMTLDKTNSPVVLEKFLIDLNLLFKNQEAPFLKKLEQVYQLFPPEIFLSFEKSTEHETDIFQDFGNIYENFNEKILHTCDDEVNIDVNRVNQQKLNEEIQVANEIQHEVNINEEQVCDGNCKFYQEIKRILRERQGTNEKLQTNVKMTNSPLHFPDEKIFKGKNGDYCYVLVDFERVNQRTNDGQLQEVVKISNIGYFKKSMENYLDILKNAQEKKNGQLQFENKVKEIVDDLTQKCNDCKTNLIKAEFPVQFGVETKDIINEESDEIRQHFEEELNIKSKAYKTMKEIQQNVEEKMDVVNNFQNYESKVQDEPVVYINNSEEEIQLEDENNLLEEIQVEDTKDSFLCVRDSEEETKLETEEDFDICIDDSEEEISLMYDEEPLQYDEESEEESEMLGIVDENEVTEIIEDYISESIPSITNFSPNNEESSSTKESLSSEESSSIDKSSSTDESSSTDKEEFNSVENLSRRKDMLLRIAKLINDEHNFNGKLKYQKKKKNYGRKKIDEKPKLDPNRGENAIQEHNDHMADMFDEEYQEYYQIKEDVTRFKMDVENLMQIETFEKLQQNMDDNEIKDILNNKDFPEEIDEEVYLPNHSDILKDVIKLQCDIDELKPVFEDNIYIPLEIETDTRNQPSTTEPFNLFEKLYSIHRKKILEFVDSNTWPYNCLVPSGLLDALYDDPLEFKPNALVITLYCVDIGFSTKITKNKNELPVETFYCYKKDEILLSFIENEKLPPQLLDSLNEAEPNLFYSGCVIAEVHDLRNGTLDQIGRILLRPCNESVLKDTKNIMELFKDRDWTYESKLKLESKILLLNYSVMCGGVLPATGAAVNLQHLLLSARKLEFNPLKRKYFSSKLNTETDLVDDYNKSESTNESQISSDLMDNANDNVYYILWKFDYRLPSQSFNIFKLYVIISSLNPEFSILLYFNSKFRSITNIRFKINLETNEIKTYIMQILSVIHQKLSPDIEVIRRYKCDEKSSARSVTCIPALFDNNIYDPNYADMSQLINELLKNKSESQSNVIECNEIESPIMPINKLSGDTQNTEINSIASKQMDHTIHFRDANNLTRNSNTDIKNSSEKETTTDHQLNYNKKPLKLSDILHADPSNLQEVFKKNVPRDQVSAKRMQYIEYDDSFLQYQTLNNMKSFKVDTTPSINKMIVEDSFQETNNQPTSSDVENCKGIKRKLSTSWMEVP
ncbi:uncharacterized protein LOC112686817 isoform X2 [Sipha flava]|uniref:Uncharacterized protein LOC112686817 isoform X2 n=1 Tax=Sipha flava TaxID=143950 RepID=A0A8B8FW28_9HEMI|nr:uncharacterized protein LOC112686817 isoform X2 [Sipha flava]